MSNDLLQNDILTIWPIDDTAVTSWKLDVNDPNALQMSRLLLICHPHIHRQIPSLPILMKWISGTSNRIRQSKWQNHKFIQTSRCDKRCLRYRVLIKWELSISCHHWSFLFPTTSLFCVEGMNLWPWLRWFFYNRHKTVWSCPFSWPIPLGLPIANLMALILTSTKQLSFHFLLKSVMILWPIIIFYTFLAVLFLIWIDE